MHCYLTIYTIFVKYMEFDNDHFLFKRFKFFYIHLFCNVFWLFFKGRIKRAYHELRINYKFSTTHICLGSISEVNIHTSITSECFYKARICLTDSVYCNSSFPLLALLKRFIFICNILMRHDFEVLKDELHKRQSAGFT